MESTLIEDTISSKEMNENIKKLDALLTKIYLNKDVNQEDLNKYFDNLKKYLDDMNTYFDKEQETIPDKFKLPLKIKIKREQNFTMKRDNYKKYLNSDIVWDQIFKEIDLNKKDLEMKEYQTMKEIASKNNIKYKTLCNKHQKWTKDKDSNNLQRENRGAFKLFSIKEELGLYLIIRENYIKNDLYLDEDCLKCLAIRHWNCFHPNSKDEFSASSGWIYDFKMRWYLTSLTVTYSRISPKSKKREQELSDYVKLINDKYKELGANCIFNMDETFWRIINENKKVIGITNSENRKVVTKMSDKSGFTAIFIASCNGKFYKPLVIFKGKTNRCLAKSIYKDDENLILTYSNNGWINEEIMKQVLREIHKITNNKKTILILDKFKIHLLETIKDLATELNIELIFVPAGKTATHQPMDIKINGALKASGKYMNKEKYILDDKKKQITRDDCILKMLEAIGKLKKSTIINSFMCALELPPIDIEN